MLKICEVEYRDLKLSLADIWGKNSPVKGNSQSDGLKMEVSEEQKGGQYG